MKLQSYSQFTMPTPSCDACLKKGVLLTKCSNCNLTTCFTCANKCSHCCKFFCCYCFDEGAGDMGIRNGYVIFHCVQCNCDRLL